MAGSADGVLTWQQEHLELIDNGGNSLVLFSSATREIKPLPMQIAEGLWVLSFHKGLGVLSYEGENGSDEPIYEEWAQNLLKHKAYKQGDSIFVVTAAGERLAQVAFLSLHDQLQVGVKSLATSEVEYFDACYFTHEVPGARLWWSLHDLCKRLNVRRVHRTTTTAALYDRLPTWTRLASHLRLPDIIRRSAPHQSQKGIISDGCSTTPILTSVGFLLILLREGYKLRMGNSRMPTTPQASVKLWLHSLLSRVGLSTDLVISLDPDFSYTGAGSLRGRWRCKVPVSLQDGVDFRDLKTMCARCQVELLQAGMTIDWFLKLNDNEPLLPLLAWLCEMPVAKHSMLIMSQLIFGTGLEVDRVLLAEVQQLHQSGKPSPELLVKEKEVDDRRSMNLFQLRYHHGSIRASSTTDILSCAVDASRVAGRQRLIGAAAVPSGVAWWMKTMAISSTSSRCRQNSRRRPKRVSSLLPSGWSVPPWVKHVTRVSLFL
jgi:hypothetical protein